MRTKCVSIYYKWLLVEANTIYAKIKMEKRRERKYKMRKKRKYKNKQNEIIFVSAASEIHLTKIKVIDDFDVSLFHRLIELLFSMINNNCVLWNCACS